nr:PTS transporter subunit EIIB [Streptomyces canus]
MREHLLRHRRGDPPPRGGPGNITSVAHCVTRLRLG